VKLPVAFTGPLHPTEMTGAVTVIGSPTVSPVNTSVPVVVSGFAVELTLGLGPTA
jgi:hypothetical protein